MQTQNGSSLRWRRCSITYYGKVFISIRIKSGSNLTVATNSIVQSLKQF